MSDRDHIGGPDGRETRKPKRRKRRSRKPLPAGLKDSGEAAIQRHYTRPATPEIGVDGDMYGEGWEFSSPYRKEDDDQWVALLFDAFATRSRAVFRTFTGQLARLCSSSYDQKAQEWRPDEDELVAAIQIVRSIEPRNEAEAAYAAQAVALHMASMKLGELLGRTSYPEPRTVAILAKTTRAYGFVLETLARLKGQSSSKQTIEVHHHEHKHVHFEGSEDENGGQPHAAEDSRVGKITVRACQPSECTALPSEDSCGEDLPRPGSEG